MARHDPTFIDPFSGEAYRIVFDDSDGGPVCDRAMESPVADGNAAGDEPDNEDGVRTSQ